MTGVQTCALRSEEHTSELQSHDNLVCRLLLEKTAALLAPDPAPPRPAGRRPERVAAPRALVERRAVGAPPGEPGPLQFGGCIFFFLKNRAPANSHPFPPRALLRA